MSQLKTKVGDDIRRHVVESIIDPNRKIADGFGTVSVLTLDGKAIVGQVVSRDDSKLVIQIEGGQKSQIDVEDIEDVSEAVSAMPDAKDSLSLREIRDIVEFVVTNLN